MQQSLNAALREQFGMKTRHVCNPSWLDLSGLVGQSARFPAAFPGCGKPRQKKGHGCFVQLDFRQNNFSNARRGFQSGGRFQQTLSQLARYLQ